MSVLDKHNRFRYTINDLVPLVSKIATRFSRVYIELSKEDLANSKYNLNDFLDLKIAKIS